MLLEAYELAPDGADYVVDTKYRLAALRATGWNGCNLRTPFIRILKRAGLEPWPKLFHTMRSSRETELVNKFSIHKVAAWLGNTPKIALKHYLQVTDEDFQQAAEFERPGVTVPISKSGTVCGTQAAQNAAQQAAATASTEQQETKQAAAAERLMPRDATGCLLLQPAEVELDGLEPTTPALQTRCSPN